MKAFFPLMWAFFMMSCLARAQGRGGFGSRAIEAARTNLSFATQLKPLSPADIKTVKGQTPDLTAHRMPWWESGSSHRHDSKEGLGYPNCVLFPESYL